MQRSIALALACGVQAIHSPDYSDPGRLWSWLKPDGTAPEPSAEPSDSSSSVDDLFKPHKEDASSNPFAPSHDGASDFFRHSSSGVDDLFKPHRGGHHHGDHEGDHGGEFEPLSKDDLFKPHNFGDDAPAHDDSAESSSDASSPDAIAKANDLASAFSVEAPQDSAPQDSVAPESGADQRADGSVVVTVPLDSQFLQGKKKKA
jgi:hypothetical protein